MAAHELGELAPVTETHVLELLKNLTPENALECEALGVSPEFALRVSLANSKRAAALLIGGKVAVISGIMDFPGFVGPPIVGGPWDLASNLVKRHPRAYLVRGREAVGRWLEEYKLLAQWINAQNPRARRFVEALGFEVRPAAPHGSLGALHHFCVRTR